MSRYPDDIGMYRRITNDPRSPFYVEPDDDEPQDDLGSDFEEWESRKRYYEESTMDIWP